MRRPIHPTQRSRRKHPHGTRAGGGAYPVTCDGRGCNEVAQSIAPNEGDASVPTPLNTSPAPTGQEQFSGGIPSHTEREQPSGGIPSHTGRGEQALATELSPATAEDAARALLSATKARRQVYIRGCPETLEEQRDSLVLSTARLKGMKTYAADDLYITVGAGTTLDEIQTFLAPDQKQVPLATPWHETTIGGLIAANVNAPLRMRYGAVRDLVLCATVALADGRIIRAGRPVIKNVAGFDLVKAFVGSHGTLGLIADVTLKLVVKPRTQRTLLIPVDDYRYGLVCAGKLLPMALVASAIMLCKDCVIPKGAQVSASPFTLVYTAEGITEDVEAELDQVRQVLRTEGGPEPLEIEGLSGTDIWAASLAGSRGTLLVRAGVAAKDVASYINDQAAALNEGAFLADMSSGLVYAVASHVDAVEEAGAWLEKLRQPAVALDGYAVVMDMPEDWQGKIDRWGYQPQAIDLMRGLKGRWDPEGILNYGEFIV